MTSVAGVRKYSSAGTDWAAWILGIGLGLTLALQLTTMSHSGGAWGVGPAVL